MDTTYSRRAAAPLSTTTLLAALALGVPCGVRAQRPTVSFAREPSVAEAAPSPAEAAPSPADPARTTVASRAFLEAQLGFPRVRAAQERAEPELVRAFRRRGLPYPPAAVYLRVFKRERLVQLWVRPSGRERYVLFRVYRMCVLSGGLGPKRSQGDLQVPEGFYHVVRFNPTSSYDLSLKLNYPNEADRRRTPNVRRRGGDIYMHGGCQSVGCMPMTDREIEQIYWLALQARADGQASIPVAIYPTRLDDAGMRWLRRTFAGQTALLDFWSNLKRGYDAFQVSHVPPVATAGFGGEYVFGSAPAPVVSLPATTVPGPPLEHGLIPADFGTRSPRREPPPGAR